jgi:hypothetical protein
MEGADDGWRLGCELGCEEGDIDGCDVGFTDG